MEATVGRGVSLSSQIRRSFVKVEHDTKGRRYVRIHGYVIRKTMQGRSNNYAPLNEIVYGEMEVT